MSLSSTGAKAIARTSPQLYRDCLRLVKHIAGQSKKGTMLRGIVKKEFIKNAAVEDPVKVESLKSNAIRGLANYLMMESTAKDARLQKFSTNYVQKEVDSIKDN